MKRFADMGFRARTTWATASAVAVAIVLASILVYIAARNEQLGAMDRALVERAEDIKGDVVPGVPGSYILPSPPPLGGAGGHTQYITPTGGVLLGPRGHVRVPVTREAAEVAAGERERLFYNAFATGTHVRIITEPLGPGVALQIARPLDEVDAVLARLRLVLLLVVVGGVALAASLGTLVARTALAPVARLTEAAERVARTRDPREHIDISQHDELGRLAEAFNTMLAALDEALRSQRRLVADASHELRTPLTSLRTNIEVLARTEDLAGPDREHLLADVLAQIEELTVLVGSLVDLARGDEPRAEPREMRLDAIVARAVERARTRRASLRFDVEIGRCTVRGVEERLERAVTNLLDNAVKWSPDEGIVTVRLEPGGILTVRDQGPGFAPEDVENIFDRFWRAPAARALPGSGLGLSIVRDVAREHDGSVGATNAPDGGAVLTLRLPTVERAREPAER